MHWSVVTPVYVKYPGSWGEDPEPDEEGADYVCVEANNKRQALVEGVRELRRTGSHWMEDQYSDGANPFTGLKAEKLLCPHEVTCYCEIPGCPIQYDTVECEECKKDWIRECEHEFYRPTDLNCGRCDATRGEIDALQNTI